jgi:peptidoglycan hydrolase-like protein with peptidoglycan-binding domain
MNFDSKWRNWTRWIAIVAAGAFFLPGVRVMARQRRRARQSRKATAHRRHPVYRRHYTRLHISRDRVLQIQEALVKAGYLHDKPDGVWGPSTRDAMRLYQQANGFSPTGLPEAKPLMKLGLGPHPLPPGLSPPPPTEAEAGGEADASAAPSSSEKKPSTSTP